jgi:hypothetical protein
LGVQIRKIDAGAERRVITAMIVSDSVCGRLASRWGGEMFSSRWANLVAGWCVKFHADYGTAPGAAVVGLFQTWAGGQGDSDTVALVEKFVAGLSEDYEAAAADVNPDYVVDVAGELWNRVRLSKLADDIQGHLAGGDIAAATSGVVGWSQVEVGHGTGIDVLNDQAAIRDAFEQKSEPLLTYPGDCGKFFGDVFERDAFVGFMGATGRGKTWWLLDVAWRAMVQRRRVAFFEVGDMSQAQLLRRLMVRATKRPLRARRVAYPVGLELDGAEAVPDHEHRTYDEDLDWRTAWDAVQRRGKRLTEPLLRLSVHANSSINVAGVVGVLDVWEREGWVPDIIVIDYADILAPPQGVQDTRDQINGTWKALRSLSQQNHTCVVTATQSDAASYTANTMSRGNFSDDRRKLDHVTAMIGINATAEEQELGVQRLNFVKRREDEYTERRCCHVAGSFALGNPAIRSVM